MVGRTTYPQNGVRDVLGTELLEIFLCGTNFLIHKMVRQNSKFAFKSKQVPLQVRLQDKAKFGTQVIPEWGAQKKIPAQKDHTCVMPRDFVMACLCHDLPFVKEQKPTTRKLRSDERTLRKSRLYVLELFGKTDREFQN